MRVLFYQDQPHVWMKELEQFRKEFPNVDFITDKKDADNHIGTVDIIYGGMVPKEMIEKATSLQLIIVPFTGINQLPLTYLKERGIRVANSHGNARYVAERMVAMILTLYGRIIEYHNDLQQKQLWHGGAVGESVNDSWETVHEKPVTILGTGEIGKYTARFLRCFDVGPITGYKRAKVDKPIDYFDEIVYSIDEALEKSEIIVNALPSTEKTRGILNKERFAKMKGKVFANIGRGDVAVEKDLYEALKNGTLRGAAIDCWYNYPDGNPVQPPSNEPIYKLPNVVLSPHVGGFTPKAAVESVKHAFENMRRFLTSGDLLFEGNREEGY